MLESAKRAAAAILCLVACLGCSRQPAPPSPGETGAPQDYRQLLERARAGQDVNRSLAQIQEAIQECQVRFGRVPTNLYELVRFGLLDEIPPPAEGTTYYYDPVRGNVRLGPLPPAVSPAPLPVGPPPRTP